MSLIKIKQVAGLQDALNNAGGGAFPALMGKWDQDTVGDHYFERVGEFPDVAHYITSLKFPVDPLSGNPFRGGAKDIEDLFATGGYIVMTGKGQQSAEASFSEGWTWIFECDGPPTLISGTDRGKEFSCSLVYGSDFIAPEFDTDVYTFFFIPKPASSSPEPGGSVKGQFSRKYAAKTSPDFATDGQFGIVSSIITVSAADENEEGLTYDQLCGVEQVHVTNKDTGVTVVGTLAQANHDTTPTKFVLKLLDDLGGDLSSEIDFSEGDEIELTFIEGRGVIAHYGQLDPLSAGAGQGFLKGRLYQDVYMGNFLRWCKQGGRLSSIFDTMGGTLTSSSKTGYTSTGGDGEYYTSLPLSDFGDYGPYFIDGGYGRGSGVVVSVNGLVVSDTEVSTISGNITIKTEYAIDSEDVITVAGILPYSTYV